MIYNDLYTIDIQLEKTSLELSVQGLNFSIHDSIYSFYNSASLTIKDVAGMFREYLLPTEGTTFNIIFGNRDKTLSCPYTLILDQSDEVLTTGILNGPIKMSLLNSYYEKQEVVSKAHKGLIKQIVSDIITDKIFTSIDIDSTEGSETWYQMFVTQKQFIEDVLLPNTFSNNSDQTPFYAFIDVNNVFNYKSFATMWNSTPVATLTYIPIQAKDYTIDTILDIKPFKTGSTKTRHLRKTKVASRSLTTGEYTTSIIETKDYPIKKEAGLNLPIISESIITGFKDASFKYVQKGSSESYKARVVFAEKEGMFLERFIITTSFNPLFKAGATIKLDLNTLEQGAATISLYSSGKYLIEDCTHTWIGDETKRAISTLIVGRKFVKVPESYSLKKKLLGAD